jgi:hypothetical protein
MHSELLHSIAAFKLIYGLIQFMTVPESSEVRLSNNCSGFIPQSSFLLPPQSVPFIAISVSATKVSLSRDHFYVINLIQVYDGVR